MYQRFFRNDRQHRLFFLLLLISGLDILLILGRALLARHRSFEWSAYAWPEVHGIFGVSYGFLAWNLLLAWVPYLAALRFAGLRAFGASRLVSLGWFALWLAFLPNAPYLITDFIHLSYRPPIPIWYDMVMLFAFASTGMMLGLFSLYEMQRGLIRQLSDRMTQAIIVLSSGMAGFGVWLGRFQRWNSWDILTNPSGLARDILESATNSHQLMKAFGISVLIGGMLLIGYALLLTLLSPSRGQS